MSINKILTSQYQDLSQEEIANLQHTLGPVIGGGLEGYWRPEVSQLGNITWTWSNASTATPPAGMNIKGPSGDKGTDGTNGKRPVIRVNSENAHWEWKYYEDTTPYIDLGVVASGEQGPQGKDGYSIDLQSISAGQGGNLITLQWGNPTDLSTSSFFLPSGEAGISPTIATSALPVGEQFPYGGTQVKISGADGEHTFNVLNGADGTGSKDVFDDSTVSGNGIQASPYGVDTSVIATQTWVGDQGFLKNSDLTNYATKTYANEASAYALSQAESWVETEGYLKQSALSDYATKTYADSTSAEALSQAKSWVNLQNFATSAGLDANKQYAMTTNGWTDFVIPSTSGYLPLTGGTVSGKTTISGSNFDNTLELKRSGQDENYAHIGLNNSRGLSFKAFDDTQHHTLQLDMFPNQSTSNLIQLQQNGTNVGSLIPTKIHNGSYTPSADDGILHIILES